MSKYSEVRELLKELSYADLNKVISYCGTLKGKAKRKDFIDIFMSDDSDKKVYINLGKGTSEKWFPYTMIGIEEDGVVVKKTEEIDAKKRLTKWDNVRTPDEMRREGDLD